METIETNKKYNSKEEITEESCKFNEGEILKFVRVRFPGHAKSYPFLVGNRTLMYGQKVVAMSDRGMAVGYINSFTYDLPFKKDLLPLKSISKVASETDTDKEKEVYKKQKSTETICQNLIEKHKLDMNLTHVEFTQFGKKVVFYFTAPARVDFRGLVKDLVNDLKVRIELRQISVRDRAASMGALGPCGRELCCSSFLSKYGNVSIKMAKNQNLTLNYSKLNGVCGQLKCCLQYEDEVYSQKRRKLPKEGEFLQTKTGDIGKVFRLHILSEQFDLLTNKGTIRRYTHDQVKTIINEAEAKLPRKFDHISDETSKIIGLSELESRKSHYFKKEMNRIETKSEKYAAEVISEITGKDSSEYIIEKEQKSLSSTNEEIREETPQLLRSDESIKTQVRSDVISENTTVEEKKKKPFKKRNNRNRNYRNKKTEKPKNS